MSLKAVALEGDNLSFCGTKWIDVCAEQGNKEVLLTQISIQTKKTLLPFKRKYSDEFQRSSRFPNDLKNVKNGEWYVRNHAMKKWAVQ